MCLTHTAEPAASAVDGGRRDPRCHPSRDGGDRRAAPEPVDVLIERAGAAVARSARRMLGGTYGRRVVVVASKGNNGNDGRVAARRLATAGAGVRSSSPTSRSAPPPCGRPPGGRRRLRHRFRGPGHVAAVRPGRRAGPGRRHPSGVDGLTGVATSGVAAAQLTMTFAAAKPGLLLGAGARLAGDSRWWTSASTAQTRPRLVGDRRRCGGLAPRRAPDAHKWQAACWVVAGSPA